MDRLARCMAPMLTAFQPHCVVLDVGSNDLDKLGYSGSPTAVKDDILTLIESLHHDYSVIKVFWCQVLQRGQTRRKVVECYNKDAYELNGIMKDCLEQPQYKNYATFWVHRGLCSTPLNSWSRDKIHPDTKEGMHKYMVLICKAVKCSAKMLPMTVNP